MGENGYGSLLKAENIRLKQEIEDLQNTIINITKSIQMFTSGTLDNETRLNDKILDILQSASSEIKIVTPKVGKDYATTLKNLAETGLKIQIIINDRRFLSPEEEKKGTFSKRFTKNVLSEDPKKEKYNYADIYDTLKSTPGIDLINNPNVQFFMITTSKHGLFSSGWLERRLLDKTILIGVYTQDPNKIKELKDIYTLLLPSFMR